MTHPLDPLRRAADARARDGMRRTLRSRDEGDAVLDLASNDYLGLARHPRVVEAAADAARQWGGGSTGSRLVTGSTRLHADLEAQLADFLGAGAALVFSSGYLANLGVLTALGGEGCLLVSDALNHASVVDGARLARAEVRVVPHRDVAEVDRVLSGRTSGTAVVVTDAVFSVDGDLAPLADLHAVARAHDALLVVDEAHSVGVVGDEGRGAVHQAGLAGEPDVVVTATLSKSLGSQGGAVLADPVVVEHLVNTARPFIFDTGLAPAAAGAAAAALEVLRGDPSLAKAVRTRATALSSDLAAAGLAVTSPDGAVVSVLVGEPGRTADAAAALLEQGIRVGCFRPPSVPDGVSRLRITVGGGIPDAEWARAVDAIGRLVKEHAG